ncbi:tRNA 5-methoxyuridine(34) synthase CmoB [Glaciecola punicea]|uniref:tRNA 5-methoxyuridine(34)/uridine 5-oxyacetic acid(34) synthase CmoB n=1 Tax=Glaciecola punicea TaxID=56804 RepID=UPI0008729830|nr:tRNA 5-methoxyuridine(34)/uridine 5-oxyacetic acid(34) synthase CmoB [Glaciecola punicea]OFA33372.1 tRNA 5-methoxyuridine(34) synthase CmoB [Glaciecola punicea]
MQSMSWRSAFYNSIVNTKLELYIAEFAIILKDFEASVPAKDLNRWQRQLGQLPKVENIELIVGDSVSLNAYNALTAGDIAKTISVLKNFMPWRKGPFNFMSINIDTEWRSDWKWNRVLPHLQNLAGKKVLDVGCGSGYHLFRMHDAQASQIIGVDPTALFFFQFHCFKQYLPSLNVHYLPIGIEAMPTTNYFDTVFSMGVLYHRQDPIKFLRELKDQLCSGGQLVLETLVIDGDENTVLMPKGRYSQMRNVWFLPSVGALIIWLQRVGFKNVKCVDIDCTSIEEQRATPWMETHSLIDFLDSENMTKTIEGYPAPKRAVLTASVS